MENEYLHMLACVVLPAQILDYFTIVGVEQTSTEIHFSLDEKMSAELQDDTHFESKDFMDAVSWQQAMLFVTPDTTLLLQGLFLKSGN